MYPLLLTDQDFFCQLYAYFLVLGDFQGHIIDTDIHTNTSMSEITGKLTLIFPPFGDLSILAVSPVILLFHYIWCAGIM